MLDASPATPVTLTLAPRARLEGRITVGGAPADVLLAASGPDGDAMAKADTEGSFVLEGLGAGDHVLYAFASGLVRVPGGGPAYDFFLAAVHLEPGRTAR